jgi:hypothetical protein
MMKTYEGVDVHIRLFLTLALGQGAWSASRPSCINTERALPLWYPLDRRFGGPQSRSRRYGEMKILNPTRTRTLTPSDMQLVASRYTDSATIALYQKAKLLICTPGRLFVLKWFSTICLNN